METVLRVVFVYAFLLVSLRIIGKRELGQLSPFELITLMLIPELFAQALLREDFSMTNAIVAASTLLVLVWVTSLATYRSQRVARLIDGEPSVLVVNGKFVSKHLDQERVSAEELFSEMHKAGLERLDQVKWAILEPGGAITLIATDEGTTHPRAEERGPL